MPALNAGLFISPSTPFLRWINILRGRFFFFFLRWKQAHKHGTGRCYALHPAPVCRCCLLASQPLLARFYFQFPLSSRFTITCAPSYWNTAVPWVCSARRSLGRVMALFSLFEKAMLSASHNDITLRTSDWPTWAQRPYLKKQRTRLLLLGEHELTQAVQQTWRSIIH